MRRQHTTGHQRSIMSDDVGGGFTVRQCCPLCLCCLCCAAIIPAVLCALFCGGSLGCFDLTEVNATAFMATTNTTTLGVTGYMGTSVSMTCSGEYIFVGAASGDGMVTVARFMYAENIFNETQYLEPPMANMTGMFGRSVASDCRSGLLVVGEPALNASSGAAHLFVRNTSDVSDESGVYLLNTTLANPSAPDVSLFGVAVDVACYEPVIVVGAPAYDSGSGRVYVYEGGMLMETIERPSNVTGSTPEFGSSVALSCDALRLLVGAPLSDDGGTALLFGRDNVSVPFDLLTVFTQEQSDARFGAAVDLASRGYVITVGAPLYDAMNGSLVDAGRVFQYPESRLAEPFEGTVAGARFGASVATNYNGQTLVVGSSSMTEEGSAMLFEYASSEQAYLVQPAAFADARDPGLLGAAVASSFGGHEFVSTSTANETDVNSTRIGVVDCWQRRGSFCPEC